MQRTLNRRPSDDALSDGLEGASITGLHRQVWTVQDDEEPYSSPLILKFLPVWPQPRCHPMLRRTRRTTVTFTNDFKLDCLDEVLPAGDYCVETDEELLQGISFVAYRRVATMLRLPKQSSNPSLYRTLTVDPLDLEAALQRDQNSVAVSSMVGVPNDRQQIGGKYDREPD